MKQYGSGMSRQVSASRFYGGILTWFAPLLSVLMAVFLPVGAMIKRCGSGMSVQVNVSRPYEGIVVAYGQSLLVLLKVPLPAEATMEQSNFGARKPENA